MHDQADEITLIRECCNGSQYARKRLYDRYANQMMLLCFRYVPDREDAKEVLLDAFYNFYKNIKTFDYRGEGSLGAWLKKIVVNQCLMHLRKKRPLMIVGDYEQAAETIGSGEDVFAHLNAKQIIQMIQALPDGYRVVFNLYSFEGKTHKEIAALLGISEHTSKSQLYKAKAVLQQKILNNQ